MNNGKENWVDPGMDIVTYYKARAKGELVARQALQEENDKLIKKVKQLEINRRVLDKYIDGLEAKNDELNKPVQIW